MGHHRYSRAVNSLQLLLLADAPQRALESQALGVPSEVYQAALDFACPVAVAVVAATAPITVSNEQATLLVRHATNRTAKIGASPLDLSEVL